MYVYSMSSSLLENPITNSKIASILLFLHFFYYYEVADMKGETPVG